MAEEALKLQGIVPDHLKVRQSRILLDSLEVMADIGFQQGGANIHYLERRLAERKEKVIGLG